MSSPHWRFADWRLDPANACLWRGAEAVPLPPKAFDLLAYLVAHPNRLVPKDEILDALWPETAVSDVVVRVVIGTLRKVLGDTVRTPRFIATVPRRGYRFVAAVTVVEVAETDRAQTRVPCAVLALSLEHCHACGQALAIPAVCCTSCGQRRGEQAAAGPRVLAPTDHAPAHTAAQASAGASLPGPQEVWELAAATPLTRGETSPMSRSTLRGERKQVTVLFAQIVEALALIRDLDPEAAQQRLDPALQAMMDAAHRYGGTVNQVRGDGIMVLFGAPMAHEDHALRACYAALAIQAALRSAVDTLQGTHGLTLQSRIGLHSGDVVVRSTPTDLHLEYAAVGPTTHLAARMEQAALPDTILLTDATRRLAEGFVRVKPCGHMPIPGLGAPVEGFTLLGTSGVRRRVQATTARGLTRFVGRQTELAALEARLAQAGAGQGQVVAVVGEAGVGKSRLHDAFVQAASAQGWLVLDSAAVSYGQATPYFPVVDLLRRYYHLEEGEDPRTVQATVTAQVQALDATLAETLPALLALLDALPAESPFWQLDPPQRRHRLLVAVKRVLLRASQEHPVLLACEDLHWVDTETQAVLDILSDSLPTARILLLVNYRPAYHHSWGSKTYYTQLRLDPLPLASAQALLQTLLGHDPSLTPLTQRLIQRTEGNPFFLEESVCTLVETGMLVGESGAYRLAQALRTMQVPATVEAVLAARMDRLPPQAKHVLQTAAVIGTEVTFPLLQALTALPDEALRLGLTHLQDAEFVYEARLFPDVVYTFKHALTQEVAYGSLLTDHRRQLHARIVATIETLAGDRMAEQVERLAHHALQGEVWGKALTYCRQAGEKATARSAYHEASVSFEHALAALAHLPEQRDTLEQGIDIRLALRTALRPLGDFARILVYLREAEALATALNDTRRLGHVLTLLSFSIAHCSTEDQAITTAQRALQCAKASGDRFVYALAHQYLGIYWQYQGHYRRALSSFAQTRASLQGVQCYERFGESFLPAVFSRAFAAYCHADLGMFAAGETMGQDSVQIAETAEHMGSRMFAYYGRGLVSLLQGELPAALAQLALAVHFCQEADQLAFFPRMAAALGAAYLLDGRAGDAVSLLTPAWEQSLAQDRPHLEILCSLPLAEAWGRAGRLEEAQALAERALALSCHRHARGNQAYALHLLGALATRREAPEGAQAGAYYRQALTLAEALGMRPLQAHCHWGLGTLYAATGQLEQARAELSAASAMYREMAMTFWLPETESALAQVETV